MEKSTKEEYNYLKEILFESMKPYFLFPGNLDLSKNDPTTENGDILARIINSSPILTKNDSYFGADSVTSKKVIVEDNRLMKFWGKIFWLSSPGGHQSYKPGYDPFYGEFELQENKIKISKIKFSDYNMTNIDKVWWFDLELDWIYEFEE